MSSRAQKAESPMVDPERTSPDVLPCALGGARCVLIRIGSLLSAAVVEVVSTSGDAVVPPSSASSSLQAAMPKRETISSTAKAVLTIIGCWLLAQCPSIERRKSGRNGLPAWWGRPWPFSWCSSLVGGGTGLGPAARLLPRRDR